MRLASVFPLVAALALAATPPASAWIITVGQKEYEGPGEELVERYAPYVVVSGVWIFVSTGETCISVGLREGDDPCEEAPPGPSMGAGVGIDLGLIAACVHDDGEVQTNEACRHEKIVIDQLV